MGYKENQKKRIHKVFWGSSYDRGLDILLFMWQDVIEKYPDAELHITYGWDMFDALRGGNPERLQWKHNVEMMMNQKGVIHHGKVGKQKLKEIRKECGIWAYPTYFQEINCITALETQADGLVPVVIDDFALKETVGSGIKIKGDITKLEVQEKFKEELISLMGDQNRWEVESKKAIEFSKGYQWKDISAKWDNYLKKPINNPLVSVITNTIRTGFWNVMAHNIANQTYSNIAEWIILDDYKEDRSKLATKYSKKYNLNIRYIRGDKVLGKYDRRYGLVRANNKAWKESKGELLVFLQDFILIPENGIEMLVDVNRHHPNALIAPVDQYWFAKEPNRDNKEDWWDGSTDIIDKFSWRNVRLTFEGIRETDNPFDFEMNYAAIPRKIINHLNGWYEYFDNGLGYDNTEFAIRALNLGYKIVVDDRNVAQCINLWPIIGGTAENITERDRNLGLPYFLLMRSQIDKGIFPVVRDEEFDKNTNYSFSVPKEVPDNEAAEWINDHAAEIVKEWEK